MGTTFQRAKISKNSLKSVQKLEIGEISRVRELIAAAKQIVNKIEPDVVVKEKEDIKSIRKILLLEGLG